jgi:hypothetical protein
MFKKNLPVLVVVLCIMGMVWAFARAYKAPIVFMTDERQVCGCLVDMDGIPSKAQCDKMDMSQMHEVIFVSKCD